MRRGTGPTHFSIGYGPGSVFGWTLRDMVDDEEAGECLPGGDQFQAELLLEGVEEGGAGGVGGRAGRVAAGAIVAGVSGAAGPGAVAVIAGVGGGRGGPAEGDIVFAREAGVVGDGEIDLIGENAGEIGGGLVGGAVGGRGTEDDGTAVVVRFALSGAVRIGGGRTGGLLSFGPSLAMTRR